MTIDFGPYFWTPENQDSCGYYNLLALSRVVSGLLEMVLWWFWGRRLGLSRDRSGIVPGLFGGRSGLVLGTFWDHFGVVPGSIRSRPEVHLGSSGIIVLKNNSYLLGSYLLG